MKRVIRRLLVPLVGTLLFTCTLAAGAQLAPAAPPAATTAWGAVDAALGATGKDLPGGVHRFGWPRRDLKVQVGGVAIEPALALGSWAAFLAGQEGHGMAMGDLVLLEAEIGPVVTALQAGGLEVAAIHNHLMGESPRVLYVHFSGHGDPVALARALRLALAVTATPLSPPALPATGPVPEDEASWKRIEAGLGRTGNRAGRVLQLGVPRAERIEEHGMEIPPSMGMATALNFQRVGERVATTGDFVLTAAEVNPVIRELRAAGFGVTALHSHMLEESPRLFFLHFWGLDAPEKIIAGLKAALGRVHLKE
jgi:hypothetical protein